jgi:hypothetical protein
MKPTPGKINPAALPQTDREPYDLFAQQLPAFGLGLLGFTPEEQGLSVLDPSYERQVRASELGEAAGIASLPFDALGLTKIPRGVNYLARSVRGTRAPVYSLIESATVPGAFPHRGLPMRAEIPGDLATHANEVRGTMADLSRPNVKPAVGAWTEGGKQYTNIGSSIELPPGTPMDRLPPKLAGMAGALQQTGQGATRFRQNLIPAYTKGTNAAEVAVPDNFTPEMMAGLLSDVTGDMGFIQHVPQRGAVRLVSYSDEALPQMVAGATKKLGTKKVKLGDVQGAYSEDYKMAKTRPSQKKNRKDK